MRSCRRRSTTRSSPTSSPRGAARKRPTTTGTSPSRTSSHSIRPAELVERLRTEVPELPGSRIRRFEREYELSYYDAEVLNGSAALAHLYEQVALDGVDATAKAPRPTLRRVQDVLTVPNEVAAELAGVGDGVLDSLRERLGCSISLRGNRLTLDGDDERVAEARAVVDELVELVEGGHAIGPDTVGAVVGGARPGSRTSATSSRTSSGATAARRSRRRPSRRSATSTRSAARRSPSAIGPAGTGKTYLAIALAVAALAGAARSAGSSSRAPRSRPASGSGSCRATCSRRSTRTCGRCSTRSTT